MPPDPEEIQEMLMKAQGKTIRYDSIIIIFLESHPNSKE
jgi:hypothetical protein